MTLAEVIAGRIAPATLERVVHDQGILDDAQRAAVFKVTGVPALEIAQRAVDAYKTQASTLAFGLYTQVADGDWETARLLSRHFAAGDFAHHQASLVGRVPTLAGKDFLEFFHGVSRHVCLIVSQRQGQPEVVRGTGFLVGPNMVLTCRHVLSRLLKYGC